MTEATTTEPVKTEVPVSAQQPQPVEVPNPEALEDAPRAQPAAPTEARFQNVDLESQSAGVTSPPVNAAAAPSNPLEKSALTEFATHMDWGVANFLLAFCAFVVMISASTICGNSVTIPGYNNKSCTGITAYQVAVGTISGFFALLFGLLFQAGKFPDRKHQEIVSALQFLWWVAGTIVLTFFGDFQSTLYANGYFASWGAFLFASVMLVSVSPLFQNAVDQASHSARTPMLFLTVASAVEMGASIAPCSPSSNCNSYNAFAVALGSISLFICLILLVGAPRISNQVLRYIGYFLVLWWVIGFGVVTFGGPFLSTGNGYFASLAAVFASVAFLQMVNSLA